MDEAYGDKLAGKVECIGLHGDYNAGLQFIKDGKLSALRAKKESSPDSIGPVTPQTANMELGSPTEADLVTPPPTACPPQSAGIVDPNNTSDDVDLSQTNDKWTRPESPKSIHLPNAVTSTEATSRPLHIVFLGSSLGNFPREAAAPFLGSLPLHDGDTLLLGLDGRPAPGEEGRRKVEVAYNDPAGHTRAFEEHGWKIVERELGLRDVPGVEFVGRYNEALGESACTTSLNEDRADLIGRHEAYFRSKAEQTIHLPGSGKDVKLEKDELLNIEWSYKVGLLPCCRIPREADSISTRTVKLSTSSKLPTCESSTRGKRPTRSIASGSLSDLTPGSPRPPSSKRTQCRQHPSKMSRWLPRRRARRRRVRAYRNGVTGRLCGRSGISTSASPWLLLVKGWS